MCLPAEVHLLAHSALGAPDVLYSAPGQGGVALGIRTRDLLVACGARVATLTAVPLAHEDRGGWDGIVQLADVIDLDRRGPGPGQPSVRRPPTRRSAG